MTASKSKAQIIDKMFAYLEGEHKENISKEVFIDIANIFLDLTDVYREQFSEFINLKESETKGGKKTKKVKWACNASMGHGKTTVLICWLKWLVSEDRKESRIPVLLVIRERKMAEDIRDELKAFNNECIIFIDSENKKEIEQYVPYHQIVIITHIRLDNLALGYGNKEIYKIWEQYDMLDFDINEKLDPANFKCKRHRLIIADEKPSFENTSIFDIGSKNNSLDWFDDLSGVLKLSSFQIQDYKSQIVNLIADHLCENTSDIATALLPKQKTVRMKKLLNVIKKIKNEDETKAKIGSLKKLKHFEKILLKDGVGRIDDYDIRGKAGRKIIIAERIDYGKIGLNILILDGTASVKSEQYMGYTPKKVKNYNDYSRLYLCQDVINTSKYSREKKGHTTQKAISERISELKEKHNDLFILPMKSDIQIYISLGAIDGEERNFFEEKATEKSKPINLLNTTGKNVLKDRTALYLTSLPRMNADHYKAIAISLYGNNVSLKINDDSNSYNWFSDDKLDMIYRGEMYAEILQIMHRTALRKIKENTPIYIYIAFNAEVAPVQQIFWEINKWYAADKIQYTYNIVDDESLYGRGDTIRNYAEQISEWIRNNVTFYSSLPKRLGEIDKSNGTGDRFRKWLSKNHNWDNKEELINKIFHEFGYVIYENRNDSRKTKMIRELSKKEKRKYDDRSECIDVNETFTI